MKKRGYYIVFEGGEGCGKTTQVHLLKDYLKAEGIECERVAEPGGTGLGVKIRKKLLEGKIAGLKIDPFSQLILFETARFNLTQKVIIPSLKGRITILSDRSKYSSLAYQGYGAGMNLSLIRTLNHIATRGLKPDLTCILDIDPSLGLKKEIDSTSFSQEELEYHLRVRQGFLEIAKTNSECVVVPYEDGAEKMQEKIRKIVDERLNL